MKSSSSSHRVFSRGLHLLLVLVLLLGQTLVLAHNHDDDAGPNDSCAFCLYAHHADSILPELTTWVQSSGHSIQNPLVLHAQYTATFNRYYQPRAPPLTLL